jgi:hypothetical protein
MLESAAIVPGAVDEASGLAADDPDVGDLSGTWSGHAWQAGNKSWQLSVVFEKVHGSSLVAHAQYADQHCSADWVLRSGEARHWQGDETVRTDPFHRCADHGHVTIEVVDEDTLSWRWVGPGGSASATLERSHVRE